MSSGSAAAGAGAAGAVEVPLLTGGRRDGNKKDTAAVRQWNAYAAKYGFPSWDDVDGDCFCSPERVQGLAHYMVHAAVKHNTDTEEKEGLAATTVQSYISNLMNAAKERFPAHAAFFAVLGGNSSSVRGMDNWYTKMNCGISTEIRRRAIEWSRPSRWTISRRGAS